MDVLVLVPQAVRGPVRAPGTGDVWPVHLAPSVETGLIEVVLAGGDRLHVRAGASADLVRAVVVALRPPC